MNNAVVIVGGDHHNTLGVIESFAEKGIKPYVIVLTDSNVSYVIYSKHIKRPWVCLSEEEVLSCLCQNFADSSEKIVLIATNDQTASLIDSYHQTLTPFSYISSVEPHGHLADAMSKEYMSELARNVGLEVPKTWIVKDTCIPEDISFPIITKAISSIEGTKANIKVCYDKEQLLSFFSSQRECHTIQLQTYIDKEYEFQLIGVS